MNCGRCGRPLDADSDPRIDWECSACRDEDRRAFMEAVEGYFTRVDVESSESDRGAVHWAFMKWTVDQGSPGRDLRTKRMEDAESRRRAIRITSVADQIVARLDEKGRFAPEDSELGRAQRSALSLCIAAAGSDAAWLDLLGAATAAIAAAGQ